MILYINYNIKKKKMSFLSGLSNDTWSSRNGDEGGNFWTLKGVQSSINPYLVAALEDEPKSFSSPWFDDPNAKSLPLPPAKALPPANFKQQLVSNYNLRTNPKKKKV